MLYPATSGHDTSRGPMVVRHQRRDDEAAVDVIFQVVDQIALGPTLGIGAGHHREGLDVLHDSSQEP